MYITNKKNISGALKDFDKPTKPPPNKKEDESSTSTSTEVVSGESNESTSAGEEWTEDFLKQAADQFQKNLEDLMQNSKYQCFYCTFKIILTI